MNRRDQHRTDEGGAALVEFALVLPLLLVVIAGIVDFAFLFQRYEVITNAAREGARLASLSAPGTYTDDAVKSHVRNYVKDGLALTNAQLAAVMPTSPDAVTVANVPLTVNVGGGATTTVQARKVTITYNHSFLLMGPILALINGSWGNNMDLVASSQMRTELTAAGGGGS